MTSARTNVGLDAKAIGLRIRKARVSRAWKRAKLAEVIGVKVNTITNYETGVRVPSRDLLIGISRALRRKLDWIVFGGRDYWWRRGSPE